MRPFYRAALVHRAVRLHRTVGGVCDRRGMDEILMLRGVAGRCPDCGDERVLLPVDDDGYEFCCTDCDAAVLLIELVEPPLLQVRAG
jgi:hypothetical protein